MTYDPLDPRPTDPKIPDERERLRDRYGRASEMSSPTQILIGLVLVIAIVVGLGLFFANDTSDVSTTRTSQATPEVQQPSQTAPQIEQPADQSGQATQPPAAPGNQHRYQLEAVSWWPNEIRSFTGGERGAGVGSTRSCVHYPG